MEKDPENADKEKSDKKVAERIENMLEEGKRIFEEARREAKELRRQTREERRTERRARHQQRRIHHRNRKKEKVLNLRIGKDLDEKIKGEAERINMPVSNLVRNILENAFDLVDGIGTNVGNLVGDVVENAENIADNFRTAVKGYVSTDEQDAEAPTGADEPTQEALIDDVPVWQEVTVGKTATCAACDETINRGDKAHMGVSDSTGDRILLCGKCIESIGKNGGPAV